VGWVCTCGLDFALRVPSISEDTSEGELPYGIILVVFEFWIGGSAVRALPAGDEGARWWGVRLKA
jgi:hypothetical protein